MFWKKFRVGKFERGLLFREGEFERVLGPGEHSLWDPLGKLAVFNVNVRERVFKHPALEQIVKSGALNDEAEILDLKDSEHALVWVDGRFEAMLSPGLHAVWKVGATVRVELVRAEGTRFRHAELHTILRGRGASEALQVQEVLPGFTSLLFRDGEFVETLAPGVHVFWRHVARLAIRLFDMRETALELTGQELMTADKVTLRINATLGLRVADALKAALAAEDAKAAFHREAQLALRAAVGARELDALLVQKDAVSREIEAGLAPRADALGLKLVTAGIRDIILPGEMKELLNRVTEAKKAAEATLITRREETAAARMQANTAKVLESSPILMRLKELEVLEKVAAKANLRVTLTEKGLAEQIVKLV